MDASDDVQGREGDHVERRKQHLPEVRALAKLVEERHDEVKRLMTLNLKQGGMIIRAQAQARKEATQHARDDMMQFQDARDEYMKLAVNHEKMKADVMWMRRIGAFIATALGISHLFK